MVETIRMKNIFKRGQTYYLKKRIPQDVRHHFAGKKDFIIETLETRDPMEAMDRRDEKLQEYEKQFEELRAVPPSSSPTQHPEFDLEAFARRFEQKVMQAARQTVESIIVASSVFGHVSFGWQYVDGTTLGRSCCCAWSNHKSSS